MMPTAWRSSPPRADRTARGPMPGAESASEGLPPPETYVHPGRQGPGLEPHPGNNSASWARAHGQPWGLDLDVQSAARCTFQTLPAEPIGSAAFLGRWIAFVRGIKPALANTSRMHYAGCGRPREPGGRPRPRFLLGCTHRPPVSWAGRKGRPPRVAGSRRQFQVTCSEGRSPLGALPCTPAPSADTATRPWSQGAIVSLSENPSPSPHAVG